MARKKTGAVIAAFIAAVCLLFSISPVRAVVPTSDNYRFDESTVGGGGSIQANSENFRSAAGSVGDLGVGEAASENFQVQAGTQTSPDPVLAFEIIEGDIDFGNFSPGAAAVTSATFSVRNFTSYGYVVQMVGPPPSNGNHTLPALAETSDPQVGTEQFGINLVANTSPKSIGANPKNGEFGHGVVAPNYATSNKFRYVSGETIAYAPKSSGVTEYTISYMANVDNLTPGGQYKSNQVLVVTGTY